MPGPSYGSQSTVTGNSLAISIFSSVDPTFLDVQYPERLWKKVLNAEQINSSVNAGAQNHVRMVKDRQGSAAFQGQSSGNNIPRVGLSLGAITSPLAVSAIGADITNEDARQYEFGNLGTLPQDLQFAMVEGCENLIEATTFFGDAAVGFIGFLSYTGITVSSVANNAAGTSKLWTNKTPAEIYADCNAALVKHYIDSNTLFVADTLYLPPAKYALLLQPMVIGGVALAVSILEYLLKNNISTANGKQLKVEPIRYLLNAGAGGAIDRMVTMTHDKRYQEMAMPLPYTMQAPVPIPLGAALFAEQKHGSFACYQPGTMQYFDNL